MPLTHPNWIWGRQREPRAIWGFVSHFCSLTQRGAASPVLSFSLVGHFLPFPLQHGLFLRHSTAAGTACPWALASARPGAQGRRRAESRVPKHLYPPRAPQGVPAGCGPWGFRICAHVKHPVCTSPGGHAARTLGDTCTRQGLVGAAPWRCS